MTAISQLSERQVNRQAQHDGGLAETILDLLDQAHLLVSKDGTIELGNAKAVELTGYTRKELSELSLGTLLPNVHQDPTAQSATLITRRSRSVEVHVETTILPHMGGLEVYKLQVMSEVAEAASRESRSEVRWKAMEVLTLAAQQKDLTSSYRQILQAGNLLTSSTHMAIYSQGEGGNLRLGAVHGSGLEFPARLEAAEAALLREPGIWTGGGGTRSELHRMAHQAGLQYLASTPLEMTRAKAGVLVAADRTKSAPPDLLILLQVLAASAATTKLQMEMQEAMTTQIQVLSKQAELSQKLEEKVRDGIIYLDANLNVEGINQSAQSILGYSQSEAVGRSISNILISSHPLVKQLSRFQAGNELADIGDIKLHHRDGSDLLANLRIERIDGDAEDARLVLFISDLSENEALHIQSQQLQQRAWLGEVTAIFAHEVRNPINNISTGLQLMQLNFEENDPIQQQITALQEDCDRLEHRMKSVLSFSRSMKHNPAPIDLGQFCEEQVARWNPKMARAGIEAQLTVEAERPIVMGDRQALDQVFTNLVNNSIQALSETKGGIIALKVKAEEGETGPAIALHFSDNGPGIPEDLAQRVFDPFFTTKESGGTGLGLAITRRIIQAHKGSIELDSFPGGTLFKITIPRVNAARETS